MKGWRKLRAAWRDTLLLLRDFRRPLFLFSLAIVGGGLLYFYLAAQAGESLNSPAEAVYNVLTLVFLQPSGSFPRTWYLQIFYFAMPIIGIGILAQGLANFGVLLFNRESRSKEWEMALASTFSNHTIVVGLGHLGYRVVHQLHEMDQDVVVIELHPREDLIADTRKLDIPLIEGDGTKESVLEAAEVMRARTLVLCTQNDSLNLQGAVKARSLNTNIHVVMRIFDDDFAAALEKQFGFSVLSATAMAAPMFAATAAGMDITHPITVDGQSFSLARLIVLPKSKLVNLSVSDIEKNYQVSVVLLRHAGVREFHPTGDQRLSTNDVLAVLAGPKQINHLAQDNHS